MTRSVVYFRKTTIRMIMYLVNHTVMCLYDFPQKSGVSYMLIYHTILIRMNLNYNKHFHTPFVKYDQTHE